jgi:hypothetical protein
MRALIASGYIVAPAVVRRVMPEDCAHELVGRAKYRRVPGWEGNGDCRRCGSTVMDPNFRPTGAPMSTYDMEAICAARS